MDALQQGVCCSQQVGHSGCGLRLQVAMRLRASVSMRRTSSCLAVRRGTSGKRCMKWEAATRRAMSAAQRGALEAAGAHAGSGSGQTGHAAAAAAAAAESMQEVIENAELSPRAACMLGTSLAPGKKTKNLCLPDHAVVVVDSQVAPAAAAQQGARVCKQSSARLRSAEEGAHAVPCPASSSSSSSRHLCCV